MTRCAWAGEDPLYIRYHDEEWGRPVADDTRLFEKLCLEGFQAGLSWLTILRKRENFRAAFAGFDYRVLSAWDSARIEPLLADPGIIRHRGKIESVLNNARRAIALEQECGSLSAYLWKWQPKANERPARFDADALKTVTQTQSSIALSKDLKKRGWTFVGPTTLYAFMQAIGMVNDHVEGCACRPAVEKAQRAFTPPLLSASPRG